jgi:NAD(P)-dependent dehydrogenase (short-subunit alcohol dehydrogenase family)
VQDICKQIKLGNKIKGMINSMGKLDDKIAIITGGATGIGKGIARAFIDEGARVIIASRNYNNLKSTAKELNIHSNKVSIVQTDVCIEDQVVKMFDYTVREFGRLDILVNNSGIFSGGPIDALPLETWCNVINVNLTGSFLCTREAMKIMKPQHFGRIINIGSISAQTPRMDSAAYTTSKHGIVGLTKSTALEGRSFGVIASCLHAGNVDTQIHSGEDSLDGKEPMMTPGDVAEAALTMATLPGNVNMLEAIVLPVTQLYIGRG